MHGRWTDVITLISEGAKAVIVNSHSTNEIDSVRTVILLGAIAGYNRGDDIVIFWRQNYRKISELVLNAPECIPSAYMLNKYKQELDKHDMSELKCERFGYRILMTLLPPQAEATSAPTPKRYRKANKACLSTQFVQAVFTYGHTFLRRPKARGDGLVKLVPSKQEIASYAHYDAFSALAFVWFYYFDSLRFFDGDFGDIRTYLPAVQADAQSSPPTSDSDAAGEKAVEG